MKALKLVFALTMFASIDASACPYAAGNITASKAREEQRIEQLVSRAGRPVYTPKAPTSEIKGAK